MVQCHRTQAAEAVRLADVVVPIIVPVTAAMIAAAPRLKLIIQYGVGVDAIDVDAATAAGVLVANIPSAGTGNALSVAEHAVFLALASLRQPAAMARSLAAGLIGIPEGRTLFGSTVLVIGYGAIARHIVARLQPFGARVLCLRAGEWSPAASKEAATAGVQAHGVFARDAARFAAQADVVIVAATLNPTSVGLIGAKFLAACKPGVHIVNIARGKTGFLSAACEVGVQTGAEHRVPDAFPTFFKLSLNRLPSLGAPATTTPPPSPPLPLLPPQVACWTGRLCDRG